MMQAPPSKQCPRCMSVVDMGAPVCPGCGLAFVQPIYVNQIKGPVDETEWRYTTGFCWLGAFLASSAAVTGLFTNETGMVVIALVALSFVAIKLRRLYLYQAPMWADYRKTLIALSVVIGLQVLTGAIVNSRRSAPDIRTIPPPNPNRVNKGPFGI